MRNGHGPNTVAKRSERLATYLKNLGEDAIEGWLMPGAAWTTFLVADWQQRNEVPGHVAEIGVHHGKFAILLSLLRRPQEKLVVADIFNNQHLNPDQSGHGDKHRFLQNFDIYDGERDALIIHECDSLTLAGADQLRSSATPLRWDGQDTASFRLFSVDGSHTSRHTWNDIAVGAQQLATGGLIIVDDFYNSDWPGVQEGVHRFLAARQDVKAVAYGDNKLYLCRADDHKRLYDAFSNEISPFADRTKVVELHDAPALSIAFDQDPAVLRERFVDRLAQAAVTGPLVRPRRRWPLLNRLSSIPSKLAGR